MARGSTLKYSKKFTATPAAAPTAPKKPSPKQPKTTSTVKTSTVTAAPKAVSKPTTTRKVITQQEAAQIAQETFRTQVQVLTQPIRDTINSLTNLAQEFKSAGSGRTPDLGARHNYLLTLEKIEEEEKKILKIEEEQHNIVLQNNVNQIIQTIESGQVIAPDYFQNNIAWVKTGAITQQAFLDAYYYLSNQGIIHSAPTEPEVIEEVIEEPVFEILPEAAAEIDISINDKMITQKVNDFEIVNGRVKGSITFMITDQFNPYYYNKEIINYLQLRDNNGVTLVLKRNVLRFSETEIDETIFYDESSHEISKIFANSFVWDRDTQPTSFSTKLEFIIEVGKLPDIKPLTAGFMGAGGLGAVAVLVLIGAAFTIKGD